MGTIYKLSSFCLSLGIATTIAVAAKADPSPTPGSTGYNTARKKSNSKVAAKSSAKKIRTRQPASELPASTDAASTPEIVTDSKAADEKLLKSLNLRQKVGQLFMIGFSGTEESAALGKAIELVRPGAIVVFTRNIRSARQISNLNLQAQIKAVKASRLPLLIAVDQEGGNVLRIRTANPLPSALALGETNNADLIEKAGHETGLLLHTLGFNMNLAPVLDVSDPEEKSFIGTRTFGSDPQVVSNMGTHFARGLASSNILSTAKHFPGHGGIVEDSHRETPERQLSMKELDTQDLVPFKAMKRQMFDQWAVMLAHIAYPKIDPSGLPATFSRPIVTGLLREKMGFDGLVITDDIEMAGATMVKDAGERAVKAVEAGVDMIMVAWNRKLQLQLAEALYEAVKSGRIPEARIDQSLRRIIAAKRKYAPLNVHIPSDKELLQAIHNPEFEVIAQAVVHSKLRQIDKSLTASFDESLANRKVFVFATSDRFFTSFQQTLADRKTRFYRLGEEQNFNIDRVMRANPETVGVLYLTGQHVAKIANGISKDVATRMIIVNVETEGLLKNPDSFKLIADIYYRHPEIGSYTAQHLFNEKHSRGPTVTPVEETDSVAKSTSETAARQPAHENETELTPDESSQEPEK